MNIAYELSVHITPNHEQPEHWTWSPTITFYHEVGREGLSTPAEMRSAWDRYAEHFAEPFRSALLSLPRDSNLWCERLSQWPTVKWERSHGSVTLAGDAAHPMTYRKLVLLFYPPSRWKRRERTDSHAQIVAKVSTTASTTPVLSVELSKDMSLTENRSQMSWRRMRMNLWSGEGKL